MSAATVPVPQRPLWHRLGRRPEAITLGLVLALGVSISVINPVFLEPQTLFDIARSMVRLGLFALGVLLVLACGGIDVSFTAIAAFAFYVATVLTMQVAPDAPLALPLLIACGVGLLWGLFNGVIVERFKAPSLIVTIGTQYLIRGALLAFIGTAHIMNLPRGMEALGRWNLTEFERGGAVVALPGSVLVLAGVAALTWFILNRTLMGRAIYALGASPDIAGRLGIPVRSVYLFAYGYAGVLAGLAGIVHVSMTRQANPFDLVGTELDVIAAVVLGGARVTGGSGTVLGTLLGTMLIVMINTSLILMGVPSTWQRVVVGAIILIASGVFARRRAA